MASRPDQPADPGERVADDAWLAGRAESLTGGHFSLGVSVIDNGRSNVVNAFATERSDKLAALASSRKGYLDGRDLASVYVWPRPTSDG